MLRLGLILCTVSLLSLLFDSRSNMYPAFTAYAQAVDAIDWQGGAFFSAKDRSEILSLTKKMGIENPMKSVPRPIPVVFCRLCNGGISEVRDRISQNLA